MNELNQMVILHAKTGKEDALREALRALVAPSRLEDGCLRYELYADTQDAGRFVFLERWASPEAQAHHHTQSDHIRHFHAHGDADVERREVFLMLERIA